LTSSADRALFNPLRHRSRVALATTFLVALLRIAPAEAAEAQDPLAVDEYAKRYAVEDAAAAHRLELQGKAAGIANALEARLGDDYAGVWFDNSDGRFVVPLVSEKNGPAVVKQFSEYGLDESAFRTTLVDSTLAELRAAEQRLIEAGRKQLPSRMARIGIDPSINAVVAELSSDASAEQRADVRARAAAEPVAVRVLDADPASFDTGPAWCEWLNPQDACDPPFRGGVWIANPVEGTENLAQCTAGFPATSNLLGTRYVITAGHCVGSQTGPWHAHTSLGTDRELGSGDGFFYGEGNSDGGVIRVKSTSWWLEWPWSDQVVIWSNGGLPLVSEAWPIPGSQSSYVGEYVCHTGWWTGSSCGTVKQLNAKVTYSDGKSVEHLTRLQGACGNHGDSGGPVWGAYSYAVGIWSGGENGTCQNHYYTEVKEIESAFQIHVGS
jgi:streptogrisin C